MPAALAVAAALSAIAAIVADWNERKPPAFLVLKPLTTILIGALALAAPESAYRNWILAALLLSLSGDICLMFDSNKAFIGGLSSFLLAHLAFVLAFLQDLPSYPVPAWTALIGLYGLVLFGWLLPKTGRLKPAVLVYGIVLLAMALTAAMRWQALGSEGAQLALVGALVFVVSDSALAIRKFVGRYRGAQGAILSTYWLAIGMIAASAHS